LFYIWLAWSHNWYHGFDELTRVFFIWQFLFQFHYSTLGWLWIKLHDLFWFTFYEVISVLWLKSRVWLVNLVDLSFFSLIHNFFYFIFQHWIDYELGFMIYFGLLSMRLSCFYYLGHVFCGLTRVNLGCFIVSYF
jgi:hypothetical protein